MALRGTFGETNPEDLLQMLALGRKTGVLTVSGEHRTTKLIFQKGEIVDAYDGLQRGEPAVTALLIARSGHFTFASQAVSAERTIHRDVSTLLLTAARHLDDVTQARELMRSPAARAYRSPEMPEPEGGTLDESEQKMLQLVDGRRTLGEIVGSSSLTVERSYAALASLVEHGLVAVMTADEESNPLDADPVGMAASDGYEAPPARPVDESPPTAQELHEIAQYLRSAASARREEAG